MYSVYILRNTVSKRHYIGSTNDLNRRLDEHNRGQTRSTRYGMCTWQLIYKELYDDGLVAKRREKEIKSYKGGSAFKRLISAAVVQW